MTELGAVDNSTVEVDPLSFSVSDERVISGPQLVVLKNKVAKYLSEKYQAGEDELDYHIGFITYGYAVRSTATSASKLDGTFISYTVKGKTYSFTENDLLNMFRSLSELKDVSNAARVFCRSFSNEYISFCKRFHKQLPFQVRAGKTGVPAEFAYLQADFLVPTVALSEVEQAVIIHSRQRALKKDRDTAIVTTNLYELGTSRN